MKNSLSILWFVGVMLIALHGGAGLLSAVQAEPRPARKAKPEPTPEPIPAGVHVVEIQTPAPESPMVPFYVRPPKGYQPGVDSGRIYRLFLMMPFVPETGLRAMKRNAMWLKLADERGWFVVSPSFVWVREDVRDRNKSFYYPEKWSGKCVLDGLEEIGKQFPVDTHRIFVQGLSGGAQFAHRFALWAPDRVEAVAVNSSGWFDDPTPSAKQVAWAITVGESDPILPDSRDFTAKLKEQGAWPLFKTFLGMVHEDYPPANRLGGEFMVLVDEATKQHLGQPPGSTPRAGELWNAEAYHKWVGDERDGLFYSKDEVEELEIPREERIGLPTRELAELWGLEG